MSWRDRVIAFMRDDRADILRRIELFSSGLCQIHEMRNGRSVNITQETLGRLHKNMAEIEAIMLEAGVPLDG